MTIVTLLTDFGLKSSYVSQMKGVIASISPSSNIIDITHEVTPQNIREGAFILRSAVSYFPIGSIHVAVVDPGVGTDRRGIVVITKKHVFVGPDNGLLMPAAHMLGDFIVYSIENTRYMLDTISNTFHGRDIFAPVAAHISKGIPFESIGPRIYDYIDSQLPNAVFSDDSVYSTVLHIDRFGNIITNIDGKSFQNFVKYGEEILISLQGEDYKLRFLENYASADKGELLVVIGSSNFVEISMNQGNAAGKLDVKPDDHIEFHLNQKVSKSSDNVV
ncbi:MAG: hypothetical protein DRN12_00015 [Thermoplasmata archaeon]|nr:MAG: hypothetical protein DRN12_00015 [Thermoplasmata archaeon]